MIRWTIASQSEVGESHEVLCERQHDELEREVEQWFCTCPGFVYRGRCRHITLVQQWLVEGLRNMEEQ